MAKKVLIIDDNKRYTAMLQERFEKNEYTIEHALSSKAGIDLLKQHKQDYFDIIVTDITMETHVSGILIVGKIRKMGFKGCIVIYSTGFNYPIVLKLSWLLFKILGADGLIPKNSLIEGQPFLSRISRDHHLESIDKLLNKIVK